MTLEAIVANSQETVKSKICNVDVPTVEILAVPPYLSIPQACKYFGLKPRWVYQRIWAGNFKNASKPGKEWRIPTTDIVKYLRKHTAKYREVAA